jgi:hypothetical protein
MSVNHCRSKIGEGRQVTILSALETILHAFRCVKYSIVEECLPEYLQHGDSSVEGRKAIRCVGGRMIDFFVLVCALRSKDGICSLDSLARGDGGRTVGERGSRRERSNQN